MPKKNMHRPRGGGGGGGGGGGRWGERGYVPEKPQSLVTKPAFNVGPSLRHQQNAI